MGKLVGPPRTVIFGSNAYELRELAEIFSDSPNRTIGINAIECQHGPRRDPRQVKSKKLEAVISAEHKPTWIEAGVFRTASVLGLIQAKDMVRIGQWTFPAIAESEKFDILARKLDSCCGLKELDRNLKYPGTIVQLKRHRGLWREALLAVRP